MKAGVVVFPGSNCDSDTLHVLSEAGAEAKYIWHMEEKIDVDFLVLPGGFSYGDYLRCGAIARFSRVLEGIHEYVEKGGVVLGICNGFQILTELKLLPGALMRNKNLRFICTDCSIEVANRNTIFTKYYEVGEGLNFPIAHGEGNYYADEDTLAELEKNGQVIFRYKENPNGSKNNIAGIVNKKGNVLGLMPHPERMASPILGGNEGIRLFRSVLDSI